MLNTIEEQETTDYNRKYRYEFELNGDIDNLSEDLKQVAFDMLLDNFKQELKLRIFKEKKEYA